MTMAEPDHAAFEDVLRNLEHAWNTGNATAFGAAMTQDADFVTVRADHLRGRQAIVASHARIFSTIYAGSRNHISLETIRQVSEDLAVVHARSVLVSPTGPLAGRHEATLSTVMLRRDKTWQITSFHITLASQSRPEHEGVPS